MKLQIDFIPAKPPETGAISERFCVDIGAVDDLLNRASRAITRAQAWTKTGHHLAAAEASGQAMMLARHAEIILQCAMAAKRAALIAVTEQPLAPHPTPRKTKGMK